MLPEVHPTALAVARLAAPRLAAGEGVDAALAAPIYVRDKVAFTKAELAADERGPQGRPASCSAMRDEDLDEVLAIENAIYTHPWTRGNFADSLRAGYECRTWRLKASCSATSS